MLSSITPLGERGRNNRFAVAAWFFFVGSTLGGAVTGLAAGGLGVLMVPEVPTVDGVVIVGKWKKGDTADSVGVVRGNTFYLRNPATGAADIVFDYGDPGDKVVVGDWNGDGVDTPAVVRGSTFYARNSNSSGVADLTFLYGDPGDIIVTGRWKKDALSGPGVAR